MVSEPIELLGPKSMAVEEKPLIGMQKEQQEMKHTRKLRRLKYSCEEVYERMDNGLCIFCDELDTPGHHDLKHKGIQIFMVDDDLASDDKETVTEPIVEIGKNLDSFIEPLVHESVSQVLDSVPDVSIVHTVDSQDKEVEESPQKSTSGNGENVAHQLFDQKPERVTSKERHLKHLKGWKFKFKGKNLSRVMPQIGQYKLMERKRKRYNKFSSNIPIEPMRTRITWEHSRAGKRQRTSPFQLRYDTRSYIDVFLPIWLRDETREKHHIGLSRAERVWKPGELVFLRKQWDWRSKVHSCGIILNIARRLCGTNLSTRQFSPPLTDFQNWKKELGSLMVCSNIGLEEWIRGLEIYGCATKKQILLLVKLANRVWERGKLLATHLYWELFGLNPLIGLEIYSWECKKQLKSEKSPFQCTYAAQIKRCGETARQIFFLTDQMFLTGVLAKQMLMNECDIDLDNVEAESPLLQEEKSTDSTKQITIWIIFKALCSAGYKWENETIKERFIELSKLEKDHELLSPENLDVHILYLFRKGGFIEFSGCHTHLKKLRAALERLPQEVSEELAKRIVIGKCLEHIFSQKSEIIILMFWGHMFNVGQKIAGGLIYGDVKFHLKHKWRSRLEFCVDNAILFTSPNKLLLTKNRPETGFCTHYNDLEQLSTEFQGSIGLNYFTFTYLIFRWNQALNCGCEAGHISSGFFPVGDVHGFVTCSKLQTGDEIQEKRLLFLNNNNKINHAVKENWFHNEPMISGVFHLQRPPELIDLHGNLDFITKVIVHWKEHPPDQFSQAFILEDKDVLKREVL